MPRPVVVVIGATGQQGSSVVRFLHEEGNFHVRAITRDPASPKALDLKERYPTIQVFKGSLDFPASLAEPLKEAYGVFGMTSCWEHGPEKEIQQGKDLVDAAKAAGVKHFIWSTLDREEPHVPHFLSKAAVDDHLKESGMGRTSLYISFYIENFLNTLMMPPKINAGWYLPVAMPPDSRFAVYPVSDTGAWVLAALKDPNTWMNKDMRLCTEWLSTRDMASIASEATGKQVQCLEISLPQFHETKYAPWAGAEAIYLNYLFYVTNGEESGLRDKEMTLKLYPEATTFKKHVKENVDGIFTS